MNEIEFIESIDACFPYDDEEKWKQVIKQGAQISDNTSFMVLHEICRAPRSKKISSKKLLLILREWELAFDHPVKNLVVEAGKAIIDNTYIKNEKAIRFMEKISKYKGMYNALSIVYFSCEDSNEQVDKIYDKIVSSWS
jgi:hypothetical protein